MHQNYNQDSFEKGQAFEDFVESTLFPKSHYDLLHKTNSFDQNSKRYVGDSKKPDFRFKCRLTGVEFHIEAKYRTKAYKEKYDLLSQTQIQSFPDIHTNKTPIYIALGYGNKAEDPSFVSLIPYENYNDGTITVSGAYDYQIEKSMVAPELITSKISEKKKSLESFIDNTKPNKTSKILGKGLITGILFLLCILLGFIVVSYNSEDNSKTILKDRIKEYYTLSDSNNVDGLKEFISPKVESWYGQKDVSMSEIENSIKNYRTKFPYSISKVNWSKLDITNQPNGDFYATYELLYKVRSALDKDYKIYNLKIITTWDSAYKLLSINEIAGDIEPIL